MRFLLVILASVLNIIPFGKAYMKQLQPRDSILVADQIEYGFRMDSLKSVPLLELPDFSEASNDTLTLVRGWQVDTLGKFKKGLGSIEAHIVVAPFEEGIYELPPIPVRRTAGGKVDTLVFEGLQMEVRTMPVDTSTFEIHDIKAQMRYPVTFREVAPWLALGCLAVALIVLAIFLICRYRRRRAGEAAVKEPAYIVALRALDKYKGSRYWAPDKQKLFYSGITDALKCYIDERFGVDAPEMTTAELFDALKTEKALEPELFNDMKDLFERADFVKFAKYTATDDDNAKALPLAVRFVTSTYQTEPEEGRESDVL